MADVMPDFCERGDGKIILGCELMSPDRRVSEPCTGSRCSEIMKSAYRDAHGHYSAGSHGCVVSASETDKLVLVATTD